MPARASRVRRMPARKATGISASEAQRRELDRVANLGVEGADEAARHEADERDQGEEVAGPMTRRSGGVAAL